MKAGVGILQFDDDEIRQNDVAADNDVVGKRSHEHSECRRLDAVSNAPAASADGFCDTVRLPCLGHQSLGMAFFKTFD